MHLSYLLIDLGEDPDRPRPGRLWLRNLYRVHQRLCMAFPSVSRKGYDPEFLEPWDPADFPEQRHLADRSLKKGEVAKEVLRQVHARRDEYRGFLFRIDPHAGGRAVILVQSAVEPKWDYAFHNASYLLAAPTQVKVFNPSFEPNERLRFRILANPVRKVSRNSLDSEGKPLDKKWIGKRVPVAADQLDKWLDRRAMAGGFTVTKESTTLQPGYIYFDKDGSERAAGDKPPQRARIWSVRFEGLLQITDAAAFRETLASGIGPGKAFGFGLLSVARVGP